MTTHLCQFHSASLQIEETRHNIPYDILLLIRAVTFGGQSVCVYGECVFGCTHCGMRDREHAPLHRALPPLPHLSQPANTKKEGGALAKEMPLSPLCALLKINALCTVLCSLLHNG